MNEADLHNSKKARRRKRRWIILGTLVVLLLAFRLALPSIVKHYVNKKLAGLKEYTGHVEDIDIALIRGAYKINDLRILKTDSATHRPDSIPFFASREIDLSVEWRALFKGSVVGEIYVEDPVLNFVKGKHKNEDVKANTSDFRGLIRDLMPLTVNHFEINNGQIHYIDKYSKPQVDLAMTRVFVKANNLSNVNDSAKLLPANLVADGDVYGGKFNLKVRFDALNKKPTFDLDARITNVNMVDLNPFFKAYGNFDVKKGNLGFFTEFAAKDGAFKGYVKPLIRDVDIVQWNKEEGDVKQIAWETLVASVAGLFTNWKKDQVATKLPIEGRFDQPDAGLWTAATYVLKNAFIYALRPSIDNTINIGKVAPEPEKKGFLQKIFGKKDKKDKRKEKPKKETNKNTIASTA